MRIMREAMAGEVRAIMARKSISGTEVARQIGVEQTWFSRRYKGKIAWSAPELKLVMDAINEDVTNVYAAGALALEQHRHTNPCLSDSASVGSENLNGWARRGAELGRRLFSHSLDPASNAA